MTKDWQNANANLKLYDNFLLNRNIDMIYTLRYNDD